MRPSAHGPHGFLAIRDAASAQQQLGDIEDFKPYIVCVGLAVILLVWCASRHMQRLGANHVGEERKASARGAAARRSGGGGAPAWGRLALAAMGLLALQLLVGLASGSLTLLADLAHAAGDVVSYLAAFLAERAKRDLAGQAAGGLASPRAIAWIDALSGTLTTLLVAATSLDAMLDASARLRGPPLPAADVRMIGPASSPTL